MTAKLSFGPVFVSAVALPVGNVVGYPGVFLGNPHLYPWKPTPTAMGTGSYGYGLRVL
jgi:hypothetical protein